MRESFRDSKFNRETTLIVDFLSCIYFFNAPPVALAAVLLVNLPNWLRLLLLF